MSFSRITHYFCVCLVFLLASLSLHASEHPNKNIVILLKNNSSLHDKTVAEIVNYTQRYSGKNISYTYLYTSNVDKLNAIKPDYLISVGVESASIVMRDKPNCPILFVLIPERTLKILIHKYGKPKNTYYAVYLTQPVKRKLNLTQVILNKPGRVGVVLASRDDYTAAEIISIAKSTKSEINIRYATDYNKPIDAIKDALSESDIYLAIYDAKLLNKHTAKWLLYMAYKKNKPLVGFSEAYTKAGAVASVYSTSEQIGKQAGELVSDIFSHKSVNRYQHPKYFTVAVNNKIQRILGLKKQDAVEVEEKLLSMESRGEYD